jgi:hypothetical protein
MTSQRMPRAVYPGTPLARKLEMGNDDARIDVKDEENLRYWSEKLGASQDELRRMVDQVGAKVKDVQQHLFGGFNDSGPTS